MWSLMCINDLPAAAEQLKPVASFFSSCGRVLSPPCFFFYPSYFLGYARNILKALAVPRLQKDNSLLQIICSLRSTVDCCYTITAAPGGDAGKSKEFYPKERVVTVDFL